MHGTLDKGWSTLWVVRERWGSFGLSISLAHRHGNRDVAGHARSDLVQVKSAGNDQRAPFQLGWRWDWELTNEKVAEACAADLQARKQFKAKQYKQSTRSAFHHVLPTCMPRRHWWARPAGCIRNV